MKMELIGALLHWPKIIFLDEPTIGLDVLAAHNLREFLREFNRREKATIILTSHNMEDIERLCSKVIILKQGELIYNGSSGGLTREGECRLRVRLMSTPSVVEISALTQIPTQQIEKADPEEVDNDEQTSPVIYFNIKKDQVVPVLQSLMNQKNSIIDMGIEEPSLEKVIQRIYADEVALGSP
jgi:ABC-2 type transport system ATP-binding protein